jgi:AraC-like DNA-binding protein
MREAKNENFTEQYFRPYRPQQLRDVVDVIWDWDIADGEAAQALAIHQAPSTPLLLMASYRAPIWLRQGDVALPTKCATQIRNAPVILRPTGPLGMIVVLLRPDAARRVVGSPLGDFANANVSLPDLFGEDAAAKCSELLVAARTSAERVGTVVAFLLRRLQPPVDSIAGRAAGHLRRDPALRMRTLAAELNIGPRHLGRTFRSAFGMSPKYFARLARIERIIQQRQRGLAWAEIAYACGMADQAHLIREFGALVGERPADFFAKSGRWASSLPAHGHFVVRP